MPRAPGQTQPDSRFWVLRKGGSLADATARLIGNIAVLILSKPPSLCIVQGDTATAIAGALAAYYCDVPFAHLEAGLRSGDLPNPFPEEGNRRLIAQLARINFAPTSRAVDRLLEEGVAAHTIHLTGNTIVDSVRQHLAQSVRPNWLPIGRQIVVITLHRRESWERDIGEIVDGILELARKLSRVFFVLPAHPTPLVRRQLNVLASEPNVLVRRPLPYTTMLGF